MNIPIALPILCLILAGCLPGPPACTPEAVAESENQSAIFRAKIAKAMDQRRSAQSYRSGVAPKLVQRDAQQIENIIERKQREWDQAQIEVNSMIEKADLEKICQFMRSETVSLTTLQELDKISKKKQETAKPKEQKIIDSTINEMYLPTTN